jgi:hypothetical protein
VRSGAEDLPHEVALLLELDLAALREKWQELFGAEPSPQIGRTLLIQAIAYRLQEEVFGSLKPSVQPLLTGLQGQPAPAVPAPGSRPG